MEKMLYRDSRTLDNHAQFSALSYTNCIQMCLGAVPKQSSVRRTGNALSQLFFFIYNLLRGVLSHMELSVKPEQNIKKSEQKYRCCHDRVMYQLNTSIMDCKKYKMSRCQCDKTFYAAVVPDTNLILINDMSPNCICANGTVHRDALAPSNERHVLEVDFGPPSYKPLPCGDNKNISTPCNSLGLTALLHPIYFLVATITFL